MSGMAKDPETRPPFLREWRQYRGMTQGYVLDQLALMDGKMPKTGASLSRLESGKQPYSQEILEALAVIYKTKPGRLLDLNPMVGGKVQSLAASRSLLSSDEFMLLPDPVQGAIKAVLELADKK